MNTATLTKKMHHIIQITNNDARWGLERKRTLLEKESHTQALLLCQYENKWIRSDG